MKEKKVSDSKEFSNVLNTNRFKMQAKLSRKNIKKSKAKCYKELSNLQEKKKKLHKKLNRSRV